MSEPWRRRLSSPQEQWCFLPDPDRPCCRTGRGWFSSPVSDWPLSMPRGAPSSGLCAFRPPRARRAVALGSGIRTLGREELRARDERSSASAITITRPLRSEDRASGFTLTKFLRSEDRASGSTLTKPLLSKELGAQRPRAVFALTTRSSLTNARDSIRFLDGRWPGARAVGRLTGEAVRFGCFVGRLPHRAGRNTPGRGKIPNEPPRAGVAPGNARRNGPERGVPSEAPVGDRPEGGFPAETRVSRRMHEGSRGDRSMFREIRVVLAPVMPCAATMPLRRLQSNSDQSQCREAGPRAEALVRLRTFVGQRQRSQSLGGGVASSALVDPRHSLPEVVVRSNEVVPILAVFTRAIQLRLGADGRGRGARGGAARLLPAPTAQANVGQALRLRGSGLQARDSTTITCRNRTERIANGPLE